MNLYNKNEVNLLTAINEMKLSNKQIIIKHKIETINRKMKKKELILIKTI